MDKEKTPADKELHKCWFRRFWHQWGMHIDAATLFALVTLCGGIAYNSYAFVRETKALPAHIKAQDKKIALVDTKTNLEMLRSDRMAANIEQITDALRLHTIKKTDSEKMLESKIMQINNAPDESESTNDADPQ